MHADLILIDERKGTNVALSKGFEVTGTLGVLGLAARRGFVNLSDAFAQLKRTNFRYRQEIMDATRSTGGRIEAIVNIITSPAQIRVIPPHPILPNRRKNVHRDAVFKRLHAMRNIRRNDQ
jgi:hypothetical protein